MKPEVEVGTRVCVRGRGSDAVPGHSHWHGVVKRLTKTQIIVTSDRRPNIESRFRRDDGGSIPYSAWGGYYLHTKCQK